MKSRCSKEERGGAKAGKAPICLLQATLYTCQTHRGAARCQGREWGTPDTLRELAYVLIKGGKGYLVMLAAYLDASGHSDPSKYIVLAGFTAPVEKWIRFESEWVTLLAEYGIEYAHAKEIARWEKNKKDKFYLEVNYLLKRTVSFAVASTIKRSDYQTAFKNYPLTTKDSLYGLAFRTAMVAVCKHAAENYPGERIAFILEHGDPNQGGAQRIAELTIAGSTATEELSRTYPIESFIIKFKKDYGALQAADMHAYSKFKSQHGEYRYRNILLSGMNVSHFDLDIDDIRNLRTAHLSEVQKRKEYGKKKYAARKN